MITIIAGIIVGIACGVLVGRHRYRLSESEIDEMVRERAADYVARVEKSVHHLRVELREWQTGMMIHHSPGRHRGNGSKETHGWMNHPHPEDAEISALERAENNVGN